MNTFEKRSEEIANATKILNELRDLKYYLQCNGYEFAYINIIAEIYLIKLPPLSAKLKRMNFNKYN